MNKPITVLHKRPCPHGDNRFFRLFFEPDINKENFEVGMTFTVVQVNRQIGEVKFALCPDYGPYPDEE